MAFPIVGHGPVESLCRAYFYMAMTMIEDIETQRKGHIIIGCNVGPKRTVDRQCAFNIHKVRRAMPLRQCGIHFCYDDLRMIPMMTMAMLFMGASGRVRFRPHYGDWKKDITYQLSTFGIPAQCIPLTADCEVRVKGHRAWIKARKVQEIERARERATGNATAVVVVLPSRTDILLGRGKPIQENAGNMRYHMLLDHYYQAYEEAKKFQKMQIADKLVTIVHEYGGRFMKQDASGAGWIEVEDDVARDKVSHAFRTRRSTATTATTTPGMADAPKAATSTGPTLIRKRRSTTEHDQDNTDSNLGAKTATSNDVLQVTDDSSVGSSNMDHSERLSSRWPHHSQHPVICQSGMDVNASQSASTTTTTMVTLSTSMASDHCMNNNNYAKGAGIWWTPTIPAAARAPTAATLPSKAVDKDVQLWTNSLSDRAIASSGEYQTGNDSLDWTSPLDGDTTTDPVEMWDNAAFHPL